MDGFHRDRTAPYRVVPDHHSYGYLSGGSVDQAGLGTVQKIAKPILPGFRKDVTI